MWPPIMSVDRVCHESYTLPPPSENSTKSYQVIELLKQKLFDKIEKHDS